MRGVLQSALCLTKLKEPLPTTSTMQVIHSRGLYGRFFCRKMIVFYSLYSSVDPATLALLKWLFGILEKCPQQVGGRDCGLLAVANCTVLAYDNHPSNAIFNQESMRQHLLNYFLFHPISLTKPEYCRCTPLSLCTLLRLCSCFTTMWCYH